MISLLIPVFNEQEAIAETVERAHRTLSALDEDFELIVINDGSTDATERILGGLNLPHTTVITHPTNRGYGTAMKTGIRRSHGERIAAVDADGTYPIEELSRLLEIMDRTDADMAVGARTKKGAKIPFIRRPAKAVVALLANTLTGMRIPDNNSGMRVFTRELGTAFMHMYPAGFSFTLTITLAALTSGYLVEFIPIDYFKRKGKSSMSSGLNGLKHFAAFLGLIIRITTYFRPLRFFVWPSVLLVLMGAGTIVYTLSTERNISDAGMLLLLTGVQIGLFGLLAEVVVKQGQKNI
ncbi:hypothetical protein COU80_05845 [Candidatus Peregrinibacteria bacterium CG10_big_fil_rev_8_21_14_0_10_55_24]|nr:MAG: hypothetical protein COU80_05845 [Candidatus Peregrinibacteria bacterium CG10_big_fil_rev_8_21_14_0_10_55_24]